MVSFVHFCDEFFASAIWCNSLQLTSETSWHDSVFLSGILSRQP
jgi:hypothetical protein